MKVINCGTVIYLITEHHIARIEYRYNDGTPAAAIYYDNKPGEIIEATCGMTLRHAFRLAKWTIKQDEYADQHYDKWLAYLLRQSGIIYRNNWHVKN